MSQVILFLDDNPARHEAMDSQYPLDLIVHAYDLDGFRSALETLDSFDVVSLDYDLNNFTELGFSSALWDGSEATGVDACGYMVKFREKLPEEILVHSSNGTGARAMVEFLEGKGLQVRWKMWSDPEEQD
jgi:hypothetical protein